MEKLQFEFSMLASADGKSNIIGITSITTEDGHVFSMPHELQPASYHKALINTTSFTKVKNSLKKRHQKRNVWVILDDALAAAYTDEAGHLMFENQFLEEKKQEVPDNASPDDLEKILEKLVEKQEIPRQRNLSKIAEKFVIEKFSGKNANARQWMDMFERECTRFEIVVDSEKIEILRLFLEKSSSEWYSSMLIKLTLDSEWKEWKEKFCETYTNKGWSPVMYALTYKYKNGSLLDYAIRKEKLLLETRKSIDTGTLIDIIATGLPIFVLNRIDRESLKKTEDLFNELGNLEHLVNKKTFENKPINSTDVKKKFEKKEPCKICQKKNKGVRYHPESTCWFNTNEYDKERKDQIQHVNNTELEVELNNEIPKN
ncbi:hypothetical protein QAD02_002221 [Eretmocerus hayati]|uniref:Uncharacterized protein n=1 Tax=Eretmocerus hayati TaxID=131215 RepID=A0ACC2NL60_9HYME|nr:hypothetical protein QAD02_002221 [Eretmocerus hayati]